MNNKLHMFPSDILVEVYILVVYYTYTFVVEFVATFEF